MTPWAYEPSTGRRRGIGGRKPKPKMTDAEFAAVVNILARGRKAHHSSVEVAANEVSEMRGAVSAADPRTRASRQVSGRWVQVQLAKRGFAGKTGLQAKLKDGSLVFDSRLNSYVLCSTGSPITKPEPSSNGSAILNVPVSEGVAPFAEKVKSEQPGAVR